MLIASSARRIRTGRCRRRRGTAAMRWKGASAFAEDDHRQDGADDREQIDEDRGAVRPDDLDAARIAELGDDRGKEHHIDDAAPSRSAWSAAGSSTSVPMPPPKANRKTERGEKGGERGDEHEAQPVDRRLVSERQRIKGVEQAGQQHHAVADIDGEVEDAARLAMGRDPDDADDGQHEAERPAGGGRGRGRRRNCRQRR